MFKKRFEVSLPYFLEYPVKVVVKRLGLLGFFGWFFQKYGKRLVKKENIVVSERIVEIPGVYLFLASFCRPGEKILEIGHVNSSLSLELASLGYKVTAIDIRPYPFSHENLKNIQADFLEYDFDRKFKCVVSVSTIEHLGYNRRYGGAREGEENLDRAVFEKIRELLEPGGKFILTVPYAAKYRSDTWFKTYTRASLRKVLDPLFVIEKENYYARKDGQWMSAQAEDDPEYPYDGAALFLLDRRP